MDGFQNWSDLIVGGSFVVIFNITKSPTPVNLITLVVQLRTIEPGVQTYCRTGNFHGHDIFADLNKTAKISCPRIRF